MKKSILLIAMAFICSLCVQADEVGCGKTVTIKANPKPGFHFVQWNDGNTENPRQVTATADITYTAIFAHDDVTITLNVKDNIGGEVKGGQTVEYGKEIEIEAIPDECYEFVQWSDGNTNAKRTIQATESLTLTAEFRLKQIKITLKANDDAWGEVTMIATND